MGSYAIIIGPRIHGPIDQQNPLEDARAIIRFAAIGPSAQLPAAFFAAADRLYGTFAIERHHARTGAAQSAFGGAKSEAHRPRFSTTEAGEDRGRRESFAQRGRNSRAATVDRAAGPAERTSHHRR